MSSSAIAPPAVSAPPRQASQFARFLARESASWVRPAAAVLRAEGERAARAYQAGGEPAALASVDEAPWLFYENRLWLATVPRAGEMTADAISPMKAAPPDPFVQAAVQWLRLNAGDRVQGISQTSRDEIGNQIPSAHRRANRATRSPSAS